MNFFSQGQYQAPLSSSSAICMAATQLTGKRHMDPSRQQEVEAVRMCTIWSSKCQRISHSFSNKKGPVVSKINSFDFVVVSLFRCFDKSPSQTSRKRRLFCPKEKEKKKRPQKTLKSEPKKFPQISSSLPCPTPRGSRLNKRDIRRGTKKKAA